MTAASRNMVGLRFRKKSTSFCVL